jgi:proteasome accessory factor A
MEEDMERKGGKRRSPAEQRGAPAGKPPPRGAVPKLCGADAELCNFIMGMEGETCDEAAWAVLRAVPGVRGFRSAAVSQSQDEGRKFLPANGGCAYIDLKHLELCVPEVVSGWDFVAAWHAMLRIAEDARQRAQELLPAGRKIVLIANNSDGQGHSYGSHVNFLVARRCWDDIFQTRLHYLLAFASYMVSSIVLTGAGKVGSENGQSQAGYQISQRADFLETITGPQTTYARPIVNSRDESHCGRFLRWDHLRDHKLARMHVIFFDNTMCHTGTLLKVGATQIVLAMLEQGEMSLDLVLEHPLKAVHEWSRDVDLAVPQTTLSARRVTALELQAAFLERARSFVTAGRAEGVVPRADEIIDLWDETLRELERRDWDALAPKLDWVLKKTLIESTLRHRGLDWDSPEAKVLDHVYASLDRSEGLYWAMESAGRTRSVVSGADIARFVDGPPGDTRAWLRSLVLRTVDRSAIVAVNWDHIRLRFPVASHRGWNNYDYFTLPMPDPLGFTRGECERVFSRAGSFMQALEALGMYETDHNGVVRRQAAEN